jgi:peptidyl-prolyl cis-trans isomerase SurA
MSWFRKLISAALWMSVVVIGRADPPNGIRAVIHDSVITSDEVDVPILEMARVKFRGRPELFEKEMSQLREAQLDKLVNNKLILHEFKAAQYNLPESIVDELVDEEIHRSFRDRATATKSLNEQGITYEKFRQQLRDQFIITALRQKNVGPSQIIISPHKIETYYAAHKDEFKMEDQVKLRMIEIRKGNPDVPNPQKLAEEIVFKLRGGASFDEMSKAQYNARQGKGAETYQTSHLRKELGDAASKLKVGEYSDPIDAGDSYYLILVDESNPAHVKKLGEVRGDIEKDLLSQERARLEKQWIERLKKKTFLKYY